MIVARCELLVISLNQTSSYDADKKKKAHGINNIVGKHWETVFALVREQAKAMMRAVSCESLSRQ